MKYNSSKFFPVFKAGSYPQGNVSTEFINEVANNYDENFKKSPLTIDHLDGKSYAWVKGLKVEKDTLFASFDEVTEEAINLTQTGNYRYPSVEFKEYDRDGKKIKYLRAISMTNFNEVKNLPQLKFSEGVQAYKTDNLKLKFENFDADWTDENVIDAVEKKFTALIKKFGEKTGINFETDKTDESIIEAVEKKFNEMKEKIKNADEKNMSLEAENSRLKKQRVDELLEGAAQEGKILPADKENYRAFAEFNFDLAKKMFSEMKVKEILKPKQINTQAPEIADIGNPKLMKQDGTAHKYEDVIKDAGLLKKFSDEELKELKRGSETFRNSS